MTTMLRLANENPDDNLEEVESSISYYDIAVYSGLVCIVLLSILGNTIVVIGMKQMKIASVPGYVLSSIAKADIIYILLTTASAITSLVIPYQIPPVIYCSISGTLSTAAEFGVIVLTTGLVLERLWTCHLAKTRNSIPVLPAPKAYILVTWIIIGSLSMIPLILPNRYYRRIGVISCTLAPSWLSMLYTILLGVIPTATTVVCAFLGIYIIGSDSLSNRSKETSHRVIVAVQDFANGNSNYYKLRAISDATKHSEYLLTKRVLIIAFTSGLMQLCDQPLRIILLYVTDSLAYNLSVLHVFYTGALSILRPVILIALNPAIKWYPCSKILKRRNTHTPGDDPFTTCRRQEIMSVSLIDDNVQVNVRSDGNGELYHGKASGRIGSHEISIENTPNSNLRKENGDNYDGSKAEISADVHGNMESVRVRVGSDNINNGRSDVNDCRRRRSCTPDIKTDLNRKLHWFRVRADSDTNIHDTRRTYEKGSNVFDDGRSDEIISEDSENKRGGFKAEITDSNGKMKLVQFCRRNEPVIMDKKQKSHTNSGYVKELCKTDADEHAYSGYVKELCKTDADEHAYSGYVKELCKTDADEHAYSGYVKELCKTDADEHAYSGYVKELCKTDADEHAYSGSVKVPLGFNSNNGKRMHKINSEKFDKSDYLEEIVTDVRCNMESVSIFTRRNSEGGNKKQDKKRNNMEVSDYKNQRTNDGHDMTKLKSFCENMESDSTADYFQNNDYTCSDGKGRYNAKACMEVSNNITTRRACKRSDPCTTDKKACDHRGYDNKVSLSMPLADAEKEPEFGKRNILYKAQLSTDTDGKVDSVNLYIGSNSKEIGEKHDYEKISNYEDRYKTEVLADVHGYIESVSVCLGADSKIRNIKDIFHHDKGGFQAEISPDAFGYMELVHTGNDKASDNTRICAGMKETSHFEKGGYMADESPGNMDSIRFRLPTDTGTSEINLEKNQQDGVLPTNNRLSQRNHPLVIAIHTSEQSRVMTHGQGSGAQITAVNIVSSGSATDRGTTNRTLHNTVPQGGYINRAKVILGLRSIGLLPPETPKEAEARSEDRTFGNTSIAVKERHYTT